MLITILLIFRVNGAIIKGFEDDVGTKTSFYGFTTNSLKNSLAAYYEDGFYRVPRDPVIDLLVYNLGNIVNRNIALCWFAVEFQC